MTSRAAKKAKKVGVRNLAAAAAPKVSSAKSLAATVAELTRKGKAAGKVAPQKANGKQTVQSILHRLFSQPKPPEASTIIGAVAKATGRAPLSVATLKLYRERFNSGKLGLQKGIKPKAKCPVLQIAAK